MSSNETGPAKADRAGSTLTATTEKTIHPQRIPPRASSASDNVGSRFGRRRAVTTLAELLAEWVTAECRARGHNADQRAALIRERAGHLASMVRAAHESAQERRQRVLAHRDLAGRLAAVLGLASPNRWNGWVPPAALSERACLECPDGRCRGRTHLAPPNDSETRSALVDIAAEAWRRDQEPAAP